MNISFGIYLLVMAGVTYLIRTLPLLLIRRPIRNRFILSFLHYIPYAVLSAMVVPAVFYAASHPISAVIGFVVAFVLAWNRESLVLVAASSAVSVLLSELVILYLF